MAGSLNKVLLIGNVGRDPEIRFAQSGTKIVNFSLATSERWKDKQTGEPKEKTEWHRVVVFDDRIADVVEAYVKKGTNLYLEGSLQTRKWTGNDGQERYTTEVVLQRFQSKLVLLGSKPSGSQAQQAQQGQRAASDQSQAPAAGGGEGQFDWMDGDGEEPTEKPADPPGAELDDEIPF